MQASGTRAMAPVAVEWNEVSNPICCKVEII